MPNKFKTSMEDSELFMQAVGNVKKLKQDTVVHKKVIKKPLVAQKKVQQESALNEFYFSDNYQPLLQNDPIRYLRKDADANELKKLKRGDYEPEFYLDLHGLIKDEAKKEIAALIAACMRENAFCANIMYGHGKNILKKQVPMWLAQHPDVLCFHQAPKNFGGNAALLVLFDLKIGKDEFFR